MSRRVAAASILLLVVALGQRDSPPTCSASEGSECAEVEESVTVRELGLELLSDVLGQRPLSWREEQIAPILASIGEGNYGEINRLTIDFDDGQRTFIVKRVNPKPFDKVGPGAVNASEHARFLESFLVEAASYSKLSDTLARKGLAMPRLLYSTEVKRDAPFLLLMEDLSLRFPLGSNGQVRRMSPDELSACLRWLAGLHAAFWEDARTSERGLFSRGSYWILDELRRLEMATVPSTYSNRYISADDWRRLRGAAESIDARLAGYSAVTGAGGRSQSARFRTLVHGDAKPENILCSAKHSTSARDVACAGIDFSWAGEGYGMYDVMYALWDTMTLDQVESRLSEYHAALLAHLPSAVAQDYTLKRMRDDFDLCTVDFMRWWAGYRNGEHFWAMPWALDIMRDVLDRLDGGQEITEEAYAQAVDREFPLS